MAEYVVVDKEQLESDLTAIADSIRGKADTTESLAFPEGYIEVVDSLVSGTEIETLIDESGVLDNTEGTVTEKVASITHIAEVLKASTILYWANTAITHIDFYIDWVIRIDLANTKQLQYIEGIDLTKLITHPTYLFEGSNIVTINRPLDLSAFTSYYRWLNAFQCPELVNISFVPETINGSISFGQSSKLTAESIQSIIDGLAYVSTAQTLTLHKDITLTDEQKATINTKGWTLVQ